MKKEMISGWVGVVSGMMFGMIIASKLDKKEIMRLKQLSDKHLGLMRLLNQWLLAKQMKKSIVDYFYRNKIRCIAIYGMSYVGERLYTELKDSDIKVMYAVDRKAGKIIMDLDVLSPDEDFPEVDAVIVTSISFYDEIKQLLMKKVKCPIISLEDIIYEL